MNDEFGGSGKYGRRRKAYLEKLAGLSDEGLQQETESKIWLSTYAANNPKSDYNRQCDACYDEAVRRGKPEAGNESRAAAGPNGDLCRLRTAGSPGSF